MKPKAIEPDWERISVCDVCISLLVNVGAYCIASYVTTALLVVGVGWGMVGDQANDGSFFLVDNLLC